MRAKIKFESVGDGQIVTRLILTAEAPGEKADLSTIRWYAPNDPGKWVTENVVGSNHYVNQIELVLPLGKLSE